MPNYEKICSASSPAEIILSFVPLAGVIFGSILVFFFLYWQYRLRKELILRNQYQPRFWEHLRIIGLLLGAVSTFVGVGLILLFWRIEGISYLLLGGLIPLCAGLGLLFFYYLSQAKNR